MCFVNYSNREDGMVEATIQWLLHLAITTEDVDVPATFELLVIPEVAAD